MKDPIDRLLKKVVLVDSGCWEWTASLNGFGYGQIYYQGSPRLAHRIAYELLVGPIPDGLVIDHLCRNKKCVNPDHLEPVPFKVNVNRGAMRTGSFKTHCLRGHELTEESTYSWAAQPGYRACRMCRELARERWRQRKKG